MKYFLLFLLAGSVTCNDWVCDVKSNTCGAGKGNPSYHCVLKCRIQHRPCQPFDSDGDRFWDVAKCA
ncbi:unnamed protein product [Cercospora beticola]|nr:unnamed protein product [Cercospora beticola]